MHFSKNQFLLSKLTLITNLSSGLGAINLELVALEKRVLVNLLSGPFSSVLIVTDEQILEKRIGIHLVK